MSPSAGTHCPYWTVLREGKKTGGDSIVVSSSRTETGYRASNCSSPILESETEAAGWRYWSDGVGELMPFCSDCIEREFKADAPASTDV